MEPVIELRAPQDWREWIAEDSVARLAVRSLVENRLDPSERLGIDQPRCRGTELEVDARKGGRLGADVHPIPKNLLPLVVQLVVSSGREGGRKGGRARARPPYRIQ